MHYNGANSYLFVNGKEIVKFKAKDSEIVASPLYLGNISKDWSKDNVKKTGLNGYAYKFSVDYNNNYNNDNNNNNNNNNNNIDYSEVIPFIHKYLMEKYNIK